MSSTGPACCNSARGAACSEHQRIPRITTNQMSSSTTPMPTTPAYCRTKPVCSDRARVEGPERYHYERVNCVDGMCELELEVTFANTGTGPNWAFANSPTYTRTVIERLPENFTMFVGRVASSAGFTDVASCDRTVNNGTPCEFDAVQVEYSFLAPAARHARQHASRPAVLLNTHEIASLPRERELERERGSGFLFLRTQRLGSPDEGRQELDLRGQPDPGALILQEVAGHAGQEKSRNDAPYCLL